MNNFWVPYLSFEKQDYGSFFCMIIDWMWLGKLSWRRNVFVTLEIEVESMEVYCTLVFAMENG